MRIRVRRGWELPGLRATPEDVYLRRRRFLKIAGVGGLSLLAPGAQAEDDEKQRDPAPGRSAASSSGKF